MSPGLLPNAPPSAAIPDSNTPAAVPRQPAWNSPTALRTGSATNTGTQSAIVTVRRTPGRPVTCPSTSPTTTGPGGGSPCTRTSDPCTWRLRTAERHGPLLASSNMSPSGGMPGSAGASETRPERRSRGRSAAAPGVGIPCEVSSGSPPARVVPALSHGNRPRQPGTGVNGKGRGVIGSYRARCGHATVYHGLHNVKLSCHFSENVSLGCRGCWRAFPRVLHRVSPPPEKVLPFSTP